MLERTQEYYDEIDEHRKISNKILECSIEDISYYLISPDIEERWLATFRYNQLKKESKMSETDFLNLICGEIEKLNLSKEQVDKYLDLKKDLVFKIDEI